MNEIIYDEHFIASRTSLIILMLSTHNVRNIQVNTALNYILHMQLH